MDITETCTHLEQPEAVNIVQERHPIVVPYLLPEPIYVPQYHLNIVRLAGL